jgi:hypothetical protein
VAIEVAMRANTVAIMGNPIVRGIYISSSESVGGLLLRLMKKTLTEVNGTEHRIEKGVFLSLCS